MAAAHTHEPILKSQYPLVVRISLLIGVLVLVGTFLVFPRFKTSIVKLEQQQIKIDIVDYSPNAAD